MSTFSCQSFCVDRCPFIDALLLCTMHFAIQLTVRLINIVWEKHILKAHSSQFIAVWNSFWIALVHFLHSYFTQHILFSLWSIIIHVSKSFDYTFMCVAIQWILSFIDINERNCFDSHESENSKKDATDL